MQQLLLSLCHASSDRLPRLALCQVGLSEDGTPPEWIPLVPAGDKIDALDGRKFGNPEPQAIVDAFNADPRDLPVDWEHSTELKASKGEPAPAAAWITAMEVRDGAVWGKTAWTEPGSESVSSKSYRYISPAFLFDKASKAISKIISAALTNRPALDMPAIASDQPTENTMTPEQLAALGLAEGATPEQITEAITKLKTDPAAELETRTEELAETNAKLETSETELANARNANPKLEEFVPRADYDAVVASNKTLTDSKATDVKAVHDAAVETEVAAAVAAGKVTPATKDYHTANCSTKEGLAAFKAFIADAPVVGELSGLDGKPVPDATATATAGELAIAASCGVSKEDFLAEKAALATV